MPYPTLHDDGITVVLDLHGATVDEALNLALEAVRAAHRRGRSSIKLIHGTSTSDSYSDRRTIKSALYALIDEGLLDDYINSSWRADGYLLISMDATARPDPTCIHLRELRW